MAVGVRSKNPDTKQLATSSGFTGILGITEPVLYGVNMRFTFPLYAAMIGGAMGGLFMGITRVARFAAGSPGLLVLPVYIPTEEVTPLGYTMSNFFCAVIGVIIAMAVSFAASYILFGVWAKRGKLDPEETGESLVPEMPSVAPVEDDALVAVADGVFIGPEQIVDEMFKTEAMGQTVAVDPTSNIICAPANGEIEMLFETGHAFGMRMKNGTGLLVHIGVDTVALNGQGFTVLKKQGDTVTAGEPVVKADLDAVKKAGYSTQTMLVITEPLDGAAPVSFIDFGTKVTRGQKLNK